MVLKNNRKGQAAIEFLMTYGWMLLVVLIVGALIFSFVDFGKLLPNKVDLNNNLRGDAERSVAYSKDDLDSNNKNLVKIVFKYTGSARAQLLLNDSSGNSTLRTELGVNCPAIKIDNLDTSGVASKNSSLHKYSLPFLNGNTGMITFNCSDADLLPNDVINGNLRILIQDPKTNLVRASSGPARIGIEGK